MTRLWLPTGRKPFPEAKDEKERLINRLWELKYAVPGARQMEVPQLRDYVDYAAGRVKQDEEVAKKEELKAKDKMKDMTTEQVVGAMKEYLNWKYKKEGKKHQYDLQS